MGFLDKLGKLLEMRLKFGYGLSHEFSKTKLYQHEKLLLVPGLTIATVLAEVQRNRFLFG
jgi:hypothetical protein